MTVRTLIKRRVFEVLDARYRSAWQARTNRADTTMGSSIVAGQIGDVHNQVLISSLKSTV